MEKPWVLYNRGFHVDSQDDGYLVKILILKERKKIYGMYTVQVLLKKEILLNKKNWITMKDIYGGYK